MKAPLIFSAFSDSCVFSGEKKKSFFSLRICATSGVSLLIKWLPKNPITVKEETVSSVPFASYEGGIFPHQP